MRRPPTWIIVAVLLVAGVWAWWHTTIRNHHLAFVPVIFAVDTILYAKDESWGFGPGGNETGLISYAMPEALAAELETGGLEWLRTQPRQGGRSWQGAYENWLPTPVALDEQWTPASCECLQQWSHPDVRDYLSRYGFSTPLDLDVVGQVNQAVFNPGSYYAYGRIGMLVLDPKARRIYYGYNG